MAHKPSAEIAFDFAMLPEVASELQRVCNDITNSYALHQAWVSAQPEYTAEMAEKYDALTASRLIIAQLQERCAALERKLVITPIHELQQRPRHLYPPPSRQGFDSGRKLPTENLNGKKG